ncbi:uncharacterized protein L201_007004 [Kwoniella dendrophila CBS 6074]|uniref:Uncharacterized protein n=1 Tax=Kwoniella dendrophila CBS 6074 TaxID=1295534 RepID=A0AAX4K353_9TREE
MFLFMSIRPFMKRGILEVTSLDEFNETRWIPFPKISHTSNIVQQKLEISEINYTASAPEDIEIELVPQLTARLNQQKVLVDAEEWDWLKGRMVIFVDDRNNVEQLCGEIHGESISWGGHIGGYCYVERIDLTLVWWLSYGLVDDETLDKWRTHEARPITIENRIKQVFLPAMESAGINKIPDLIITSSLFWDEGFIRDYSKLYTPDPGLPSSYDDRPGFTISQIQWHQSRLTTLFDFLKEIYDNTELPIMFRTRHIRSNMENGGGLKIAQLDQGAREICDYLGIKLFRWGDLLEGITNYYDNDQHFPLGPNTYLFGE